MTPDDYGITEKDRRRMGAILRKHRKRGGPTGRYRCHACHAVHDSIREAIVCCSDD